MADLQTLRTEFYARGFEYLADGGAGHIRANRFLNDAYQEVCEAGDWPFLLSFQHATGPLVDIHRSGTGNTASHIDDECRKIRIVRDETNDQTLVQRNYREAPPNASLALNSNTPGPPFEWVLTSFPNSLGTPRTFLMTYPQDAVTLSISYYSSPPELSADGDEPWIPKRYQSAIVEYAVASALRDAQDPDWQVARQSGDLIVARMHTWADQLEPDVTRMPMYGEDM